METALDFDQSAIEARCRFKQEVLNKFPQLRDLFGLRCYGTELDAPVHLMEADLPEENIRFIEAGYGYPKRELQFIHYTSWKSLKAIIESGSIRLSNLHNMNDPLEVSYEPGEVDSGLNLKDRAKKALFAFSMCETMPEPSRPGAWQEDLTLWRLYSQDGKGAAIVFSIINDPRDWYAYHLADVRYGEKNRKILDQLQLAARAFNTEELKVFLNIFKLLAFHKGEEYQAEKEVRLLYKGFEQEEDIVPSRRTSYKDTSIPVIQKGTNRYGHEVYYKFLPLVKEKQPILEQHYLGQAPQLMISSVILGPKFPYDYRRAENTVAQLVQKHLGYTLTGGQIISSQFVGKYR